MTYCKHIYESVKQPICPHCNKNTHEINWVQELGYRRAYSEKVGLDYKKAGWTSI